MSFPLLIDAGLGIVASSFVPWTAEEQAAWISSVSFGGLLRQVLGTYWTTWVALVACAGLYAGTRELGWFSLPPLALALQQELLLLSDFADVTVYYPLHIEGFLVAALSSVLLFLAGVALLLCLPPKKVSANSATFLGVAVLALATVAVDGAYFLFFITPLGGNP